MGCVSPVQCSKYRRLGELAYMHRGREEESPISPGLWLDRACSGNSMMSISSLCLEVSNISAPLGFDCPERWGLPWVSVCGACLRQTWCWMTYLCECICPEDSPVPCSCHPLQGSQRPMAVWYLILCINILR